jgi:dUTP pyrophosphatase
MQGVRFEKVSRFKDVDLPMPVRKTAKSAGYDMVVAEDIVIPSQRHLQNKIETPLYNMSVHSPYLTLDQIAELTKNADARPTLVSTGMKCYLPDGYWLQLVMRSSGPLKYWLLTANAVGVIDADYVDNPDNEGEIFF